MPKDLPILWWMDAKELSSYKFKPVDMQLISDAIARWEKDGEKTLNELKEEIRKIIEGE